MSKKRALKDTIPLENKTSAKKNKSEISLENVDLRWEWESAKDQWKTFPSKANESITKAFIDQKSELTVTIEKNQEVRILCDKMIQKNKRTGYERRIRCCCKDNDDWYSWRWKNESDQWLSYDLSVSVQLERAFQTSQSNINVKIGGRSYVIDITKKEQKNTDTGVSRQVLRVKSEASISDEIAETENGAGEPSTSVNETVNRSSKRRTSKEPNNNFKAENVDAEDLEDEVEPAKPARPPAKTKSSGTRTLILKGKAPVDSECVAKVGIAHVYCEGNDVYDAMLNQTNLQNNNNKYYLMQLLEDDSKRLFSVWFRWGRVGFRGQNNLIACGPDLEEAKQTFCQKFFDKTKNEWADRSKFKKVAGKYDLVKMDYNAKDEADGKKKTEDDTNKKTFESQLDKKIQKLIELICNVKAMEGAVMEMKYDTKKAPLGKLSEDQIKAGNVALKKIESCLGKGDLGQKLVQACDEFYTRIPHDFGMQRPPIIRTKQELRLKMSLLEALADIEVAMKIIKESESMEHPIDSQYKQLGCEIKPLASDDSMFSLINEYLQITHASTHNLYKMAILNVYEVFRHGEKDKFKDYGNRMLLWHGSRLTNWASILSQGLRVAPPEAPVTGYMFGKGIYFADVSSKSANYCFATKSNNTGLLLLCEVSLGNCNELLIANYEADKLPHGKHSVKGLGKTIPDPTTYRKLSDGTVVPLGKLKDANINKATGYSLNYNEYVVYDPSQIRIRYILEICFNFK